MNPEHDPRNGDSAAQQLARYRAIVRHFESVVLTEARMLEEQRTIIRQAEAKMVEIADEVQRAPEEIRRYELLIEKLTSPRPKDTPSTPEERAEMLRRQYEAALAAQQELKAAYEAALLTQQATKKGADVVAHVRRIS